MSTTTPLERLAALPTLQDVPREQLEWLLEHGRIQTAESGTRLGRQYQAMSGVFVVLSGRFSVRVDQEGVEREVREVLPGQITGYLPYSRVTTPRGFLVADGPVELLQIPEEQIRAMTRECYEFTALCVHAMLDRVRQFKADDKQQEKMAALGRLSAGLAHELNNPASAVARAARELGSTRAELGAAARAVGGLVLDEAGTKARDRLEAAARRPSEVALSAVEQADLEDGLLVWLDGRGLDPDLAYPLARAGLTTGDLEEASNTLDAGALGIVLRYLAVDRATEDAAADLSSAADRIHSLVSAVKKHTHMDRAPAREPIRLDEHLADAVTLMSAKASGRDVTIGLTVDPRLPPVMGTVVELNQVWMQLVDNALDAAPDGGRVSVEVGRAEDTVVVRVVDDGPGIPADIRERVFEPFFTTKDVGVGRGLGLDIVRTVVLSHQGIVSLESVPGRTEFRVTLPVAEAGAG